MTDVAISAAAGTALVLCKDRETKELIAEALQPLAVRPEMCDDVFGAISLLDRQKFEAVIVDLRLGEEARLVMGHLRFSPANRTAVSFAITTGEPNQRPGVSDSTFQFQRPLTMALMSQTLRAAYGLVVRERRRYFRCPVAIPVRVEAEKHGELVCETVNISEGGMAVACYSPLDCNLPARLRFQLPDHSTQLLAHARVCWGGKSKLIGLEFQYLSPPQMSELQEWLACKLEETLPEEVADLFRNIS